MSAPLKTFMARLPVRTAGLHAHCTRATLTSAPATTSMLQQQLRLRTDHSDAAQKEIDAGTHRTAADLARKQQSQSPPHSYPASDPARAPIPLDWNSFFKLRMRRRRIQVFFSATTGLLGFAAGAALLPTGLAEPVVQMIPLDPFISLGLMTVAFAGVGWLVGPSIGGQVFYLLNRRLKGQIKQKEAEFFARVKKNRVDPTNSSAANPGESTLSFLPIRQSC